MPVSGLVITLAPTGEAGAEVIRRLRTDLRFTCGEVVGNRLPVALETVDDSTGRDVHQWLSDLPGVEHLDVVFVGFDDDETHRVPHQTSSRSTQCEKECGEWT